MWLELVHTVSYNSLQSPQGLRTSGGTGQISGFSRGRGPWKQHQTLFSKGLRRGSQRGVWVNFSVLLPSRVGSILLSPSSSVWIAVCVRIGWPSLIWLLRSPIGHRGHPSVASSIGVWIICQSVRSSNDHWDCPLFSRTVQWLLGLPFV